MVGGESRIRLEERIIMFRTAWRTTFFAIALACCCSLAAPKVAKSAEPFSSFISPVSNFTNFEDPRATTEVRPIFMYHSLAEDFAPNLNPLGYNGGGSAYLFAVQLRAALTDRLALIATKDGYVWLRPDGEVADAVEHDDGFANIAAGLKYSVLRDEENERIATVGLRYEAPSGDAQVLQGKVFRLDGIDERGDGLINPFLSGGMKAGNFHFLGYWGARIALDDVDSTFMDLSLHGDYQVGNLYPLIEVNWVQTLNGGDRTQLLDDLGVPLSQEGFDVINFGASKGDDHGVVTMAFGTRYRVLGGQEGVGVDLGAAIEVPLTERQDLFGWRVSSDVIVSLN